VTTVTPIVTPPVDAPRRPPHSRRWWIFVGLGGLLLVGLVGASLVEVPYYAFSPGRPVNTTPLVSVSDGPSFEPEGDIYLTTVSLRRATIFEALAGWLDPTVDVVKEEVILPPGTPPSQLRASNLEAMDGSKQAALGVAYEALGFDAIKGTGATVAGVVGGSPADGVLAEGDTVVEVEGDEVDLSFEVSAALAGSAPGDEVGLVVEGADGGRRDVRVVLGENPDVPGTPFLGVLLQTRDFELDFPFDVTIDSEDIGGPSAGLAFTLEVLDRLTAGELTGGMSVAATGEIGLDGRIGPIGGAAQKGVAVEDAGISLFLVPRGNLEQATRETSSALRVEPVDTLEDALDVLEDAGGDPLVRLGDEQVSA
jgi:PDZ domain-containing protein